MPCPSRIGGASRRSVDGQSEEDNHIGVEPRRSMVDQVRVRDDCGMAQAGLTTVVIADSHHYYRRGLVRAIAANPELALVGVAHDGERALALIREARPDVAMLDVRLPRLDGFAVCEELSDRASPRRTGLVLLIAVPDQAQALRARSIGVSACLGKDASREEICRALIHVGTGARSAFADGAGEALRAAAEA